MIETIAEPDAPTTDRRRFGIGDTMIVVAMLALWFTLCSDYPKALIPEITILASRPIRVSYELGNHELYDPRVAALWRLNKHILDIWMSVVAFAMVALLLLRARRPRPPLARMILQPTLPTGILIGLPLLYCFQMMSLGRVLPHQVIISYFFDCLPLIWMILWWKDIWRRKWDWIERFSRYLGWAWFWGMVCVVCNQLIFIWLPW